ncbi:MAG: hypothetical protein NVS9B15_14540 [Acidobacteriaceae bacterium]
MKSLLAACCAAVLVGVLGCGGSNSASSQVNGNYALQGILTLTQGNGGGYFLGGPLTGSGSGIKGIFHILDSANCISSTVPVPVSGTDSGTKLRLTTTAVQSQTFDIAATISTDGGTISAGTYKLTGGCSAGQGGTITGFRVAPFIGTYAGNLTVADVVGNPTSTQIATTANLTQSSSADTQGYFSATGALTFNSPCFANFAIASTQIFGTQFLLVATPNGAAPTAGTPTLTINGFATDASAKQISGTFATANMSAGCTSNGFVLLIHP